MTQGRSETGKKQMKTSQNYKKVTTC